LDAFLATAGDAFLAPFCPLGVFFVRVAPFFGEAFSGATWAPCSAAAAFLVSAVASAFGIVVFVLLAVDPRTTIHRSTLPVKQVNFACN
jgi:hypothetical protein